MIKFILDVVEAKKVIEATFNIKILLQLKAKRSYHPIYDVKYIDLFSKMENCGEVFLLSHTENLYNLIYKLDVVLSVFYTSAA
jgi:hypothetical protein